LRSFPAQVIVGGESGPKARPCDVEWIRSIVRQCKAAKVPCFVKQLGSRPYLRTLFDADGCFQGGVGMKLGSRAGSDPEEWPEDLRVRELAWAITRKVAE